MIRRLRVLIPLTLFYSAARVDGPHDILIQPDALRAPEVILGMDWGTSADIWNLGCLVSRPRVETLCVLLIV